MKANWQYLKKLLRHKWFTFLECRKLGIPWRGLVHDWTKFLPDEFRPYARWFYGPQVIEDKWLPTLRWLLEDVGGWDANDIIRINGGDGTHLDLHIQQITADGAVLRRPEDKEAFNLGWNAHQKRNKHHWQYWVMIEDDSGIMGRKGLPMPDRYRREMLADWRGAGRAYGTPDTRAWYLRHRHQMLLHLETRSWLEWQLEIPLEDHWKGEVDE